jgi:hypothetical protein
MTWGCALAATLKPPGVSTQPPALPEDLTNFHHINALVINDPEAKETGGWRFARYKADGSLIEQDEASACFQCHTQVEDRDYVFSQPLDNPLP